MTHEQAERLVIALETIAGVMTAPATEQEAHNEMMREALGRQRETIALAREAAERSKAHTEECRRVHQRLLEQAGLELETTPAVN
jgi:hypothetical protein